MLGDDSPSTNQVMGLDLSYKIVDFGEVHFKYLWVSEHFHSEIGIFFSRNKIIPKNQKHEQHPPRHNFMIYKMGPPNYYKWLYR